MEATAQGEPVIAARLRAARERRGWSREELAVSSGLSWPAISQIESGRRPNPRAQTVAALARALGVSVEYLIGAGDPPAVMLRHRALIYRSDAEFVDSAGPLLAEGVEAGDAMLAVTTQDKIELLRGHLGRDAGNVRFADAEAWYSTPTAALEAYREFATTALQSGAPWLRVIGEPVAFGARESELRAWARYESLLNLIFAPLPLTLVCPYDEERRGTAVVAHARATHCETVSGGAVEASADYREPGEFCLDD